LKKIEKFIFPDLEVEVIKGVGPEVEEMFSEFLKNNFDKIEKVKVYYDRIALISIRGKKLNKKKQIHIIWKKFYKNVKNLKIQSKIILHRLR